MNKKLTGMVAGFALLATPVFVGCQDRQTPGALEVEEGVGGGGMQGSEAQGGAGVQTEQPMEPMQPRDQGISDPAQQMPQQQMSQQQQQQMPLEPAEGGSGSAGQGQPMGEDDESGVSTGVDATEVPFGDAPEQPAQQPAQQPSGQAEPAEGGSGSAGQEQPMGEADESGISTGIEATDIPGGGGTGTDARDEFRNGDERK